MLENLPFLIFYTALGGLLVYLLLTDNPKAPPLWVLKPSVFFYVYALFSYVIIATIDYIDPKISVEFSEIIDFMKFMQYFSIFIPVIFLTNFLTKKP